MGIKKTAILLFAMLAGTAAGEPPRTGDVPMALPKVQEPATADTVFVIDTVQKRSQFYDGTPWNRSIFHRERLLRRSSIDPALSVAYTYSVSFFSTPDGSASQTSFLAHLGYEFADNLHLFADLGLWMPLHSTFDAGTFEEEDVRTGKVKFVLPAVALEYKPTSNSYVRLMLVNEDDARKAYGPILPSSCYWRNSIFCP